MYPGPGGYAMRPPSAGTAETLILIGFILQAIGSVVIIIGFAFLGLILGGAFLFFGVIAGALGLLLAGLLIALPILMIYFAWVYSYQRTRRGDYEGAKTPTLILGIIGLVVGGLITGILYIIAYLKLGDAANEQRQMAFAAHGAGGPYGGPGPAYATPYGQPAPAYGSAPGPSAPVAPAAPMGVSCPRCGRPATYIPQYNRHYCYPCQQYV